MILLPQLPQDLEEEGRHMHNCVGGYVGQVSSGSTRIVFLRKRSEPQKSLATIEVRDGAVVQAKAFANTPVSAPVAAYIRLWAKEKGLRIKTADLPAPLPASNLPLAG